MSRNRNIISQVQEHGWCLGDLSFYDRLAAQSASHPDDIGFL